MLADVVLNIHHWPYASVSVHVTAQLAALVLVPRFSTFLFNIVPELDALNTPHSFHVQLASLVPNVLLNTHDALETLG